MKLQPNEYSCGIYAVFNLLKALNIKATITGISKFTGTTPEKGTNEFGVLNALTNFNVNTEVINSKVKDLPVDLTLPMVICINNFNHWAVIIAKIENNYILIDSLNTEQNKKVNGIHVLNRKSLTKKWKSNEGLCYGIVCKK